MSASAREVRKTVTILFCDLVHSTGLAEGDPEAYRRVQTRFFDRMREIVERHGGTVEKFIGDEVMAVFGVPAVHEDDALRAVRAAQEMQDAPARARACRRGSASTRARCSPAIHEQSLGLVAGEPVIVAKRLEQGAAAGEIIIGKATYPLVKHAVSAGPLERIPVKGKTGGGRAAARRRGRPARRRASRAGSTSRSSGAARSSASCCRHSKRRGGAELPALHGPRAARHRQVAPRRRARSAARRARDGSGRPVPALRRGDHVLAARRRSCARSGTRRRRLGTTRRCA